MRSAKKIFFPCGSPVYAGLTVFRALRTFLIGFLLSGAFSIQASSLNEWTFEADPAGRTLSQAINSGTSIPPAQFSAGASNTVFTTNRMLTCIGDDPGSGGFQVLQTRIWQNCVRVGVKTICADAGNRDKL